MLNFLDGALPSLMDGKLFEVAYSDLATEKLKKKSADKIKGCIQDAIELEDQITRRPSFETGERERLMLVKAQTSLKYLELIIA